ncbi:LysE family translocator [Thalassotalea agarivorans]|uniref:Threonine/homoserine/homoserine lactone efflux protein n=1 Tax=Thalassotalea agarivorans TaxID=349064 RepID=A0A1I0ESS0_THASX|nr:LysE family translocator [Thalassotalea agarivorans]SET48473.1 Threonine/homoserine/homoserine lactone efflux protein [Thalassotalea agarivorans]
MMYLQEFILVASLHLIAVASPGPDFALVLKQSIRYGRATAIYSSLGIATGILLHVTYSLIGIGLVIQSNPNYLLILKYVAAAYFLYIAFYAIRAKAPEQDISQQYHHQSDTPSPFKAFRGGFLINGLNVKATLFFVSVFSGVIATTTPFDVRLGYGLYMAVATGIWFCFLSLLLTHNRIRSALVKKGYWLDRLMGVVLLLLALELIFGDLK